MADIADDYALSISAGALDDVDLADVDLSGLHAEWAIITSDERGLHVTMRLRKTGSIPSTHATMRTDGGD